MADTFQLITGLPEDRPKVYNLAGKTTDEAMKMLRYLKRNAFFGTHTGLPKEIRNSNINESLISNIGDYSVLDVFAYPQTKCIIGTVVNFHISNDVNPLGETYVYPCTDKNKPMGYMISDATPDKMGVCLVHGVLEVPLYYFSGSVEEKTDYVEYDLDNKCFKFANFGYPVFNVYQDVDGDWIAIILFGDIASDYEYDGPFAVSVAGVTGSTMYVNVAEGDIVDDNYRYTCSGIEYSTEDLTSNIGLSTGETLWLSIYYDLAHSVHSYDFITAKSNLDIVDVSGNTAFYRIAENVGGEIRQLQYGDVFGYIDRMPYKGPFDVELLSVVPIYREGSVVGMSGQLSVLDTSVVQPYIIAGHVVVGSEQTSVSGETLLQFTCPNDTSAYLYLYKDTSANTYKFKVVGRINDSSGMSFLQETFYTRIASFTVWGGFHQIQYGDVVQPVNVGGGTSSEVIQDLYSALRIVSGTTVTSPAICLTESDDYVNIVGGTNTYVTRGISGEIIVGSTYTLPQDVYQDLTSFATGGTASVGITGSNSKVNFEGMGNNYITKIRSNATIEERQGWGTHYNSETGEDELKDAGWRGIIPLKIFDNLSDDSNIMTEISMLSEADGSTVSYPLIVPDTTDEELSIIADVALGKTSTSDIPKELIDKALDFALDRISNDKSPYYNSTLEDPDDEALRNIPNADNIIVYGVIPVLNSFVSGDTVATLGIYGSTNTVTFVAGNNVLFSSGEEGEIIVDAIGGTASYTGSFYVTSYDATDGEVVTHHYTITDTNDRAPSNLDYAGWVHIGNDSYHVDAISGTFVDGDSVYLIGTFASDNSVSLAFSQIHSPSVFPNINANQFCVRICYASGGIMHQTQYGDIVQPAKLVGDGTTVQVIGNTITATTQDLTANYDSLHNTGILGLSNSSSNVKLIGGSNITIGEGENLNELIISASGSTYQNLSATVSGTTASIGITDGFGFDIIEGDYIEITGTTDGDVIISGSSQLQDLTSSISEVEGTATIGLTGSTNSVVIKQGSNVSITEGQNGEIVLGATVSGGTFTQDINATVSGGTAFIGLTGSTNNVKLISDGSVGITSSFNNTIQLAVSGGTGGGGSYNNQYIYTQPNETSATSVDDAVINITPNTHVFFAVYHNLREINSTKYFRYYWTGDEPSGQYKRTRHLTNYSNPDYDGGVGYGSEMHLTAPSENCSVIIDVFYESTCIVSAEHTIILQSGLRIEPSDFVPLYENDTYVFTFVSGSTSFWYVHGIG